MLNARSDHAALGARKRVANVKIEYDVIITSVRSLKPLAHVKYGALAASFAIVVIDKRA